MRRYQELAFRVAYAITGSAQDAEEAAQDAFTRAYYALPRFRLNEPFRPWLFKILANSARNRRDSSSRHFSLSLNDTIGSSIEDPGRAPELVVIDNEEAALILGCLNGLRPDDRAVIACRYFLDLSEAEMAAALGIARGTVKSRLSRALKRMQIALRTRDSDHA